VEPKHAVPPGVDLKNLLGEGVVSPYEEHTARIERGFTLSEWQAMVEWDRALVVAQRRVSISIGNHQADAQIDAAKK